MSRKVTRSLMLASVLVLASSLWGCPGSTPPFLGDVDLPEAVETLDGELGDLAIDLPGEVPPGPCATTADCPAGLVCDPSRHACVPCGTNRDCGDGMRCVDGLCQPGQKCTGSKDCPDGLVCDADTGMCVECTRDPDCGAGRICIDQTCADKPTKCKGDGDCPDGKVCDFATAVCVGCRNDTDCPGDRYCDPVTLTCRARACTPGTTDCLGNAVAVCKDNGSGWDLGKECLDPLTCKGGKCVGACTPRCDGRQCGDDGCGGSCGTCPAGRACQANGVCAPLAGTCAAALQCMQACSSDFNGCVVHCTAGIADPAELSRFYELLKCLGTVCDSSVPGTECWTGAIQGKCAADYQACAGTCQGSCAGRQCGDDGCGVSCGTCQPGTYCVDGRCSTVCVPRCEGRQCGDDGCNGQCGNCSVGQVCDWATGQCVGVCTPSCYRPDGQVAECGTDGCGGLCGTCPPDATCNGGRCLTSRSCSDAVECAFSCTTQGCLDQCAPAQEPQRSRYDKVVACARQYCGPAPTPDCLKKTIYGPCAEAYKVCQACQPNCLGRECGPDGCGGACGTCDGASFCQDWRCTPVCTPSCDGVKCGSDGCGGSCGTCPEGTTCANGFCTGCEPSCVDRQCGSDGCGGVCGYCPPGSVCQGGRCLNSCIPRCDGRQCGDDGCGGQCGLCAKGQTCVGGQCVGSCTPSCLGRQCGGDGCGGSCGACGKGYYCGEGGLCLPLCTPNCAGKACGPDGCGGTCGTCSFQEYCDGTKCKVFRSCSDMFNCWSACAPDDQACVNQCWLDASPEAQQQYNDLMVCMVEVCGQNGSDQCYQDAYLGKCRAQYYACVQCTPNCTGRECGADGCGGTCGTCPAGAQCSAAGLCPCQPSCWGRECGPNGCGGSCGTCAATEVCNGAGLCTCSPSCAGRQCGGDGCGGSCGQCPAGQTCVSGACKASCTPSCAGKMCGDDGCGGLCGECPPGLSCQKGLCMPGCLPQCDGKRCGPDGCGGSCGTCPSGSYCLNGACQQECLPSCLGRQCGPDGCGGVCGTCTSGYYCGSGGACLPSCTPNCAGRTCGADGCGGQCGYCGADQDCSNGTCVTFVSCFDILTCSWQCPANDQACGDACFRKGSPAAQKQFVDLVYCIQGACAGSTDTNCPAKALQGACKTLYQACTSCTPDCVGKACGPDGCGGQCGTCPGGAACDDLGQCPCQPRCTGRQCGPDGCGGLCGTCTDPLVCTSSGLCQCQPSCDGKLCGPDGCGGTCGRCPDGETCNAGQCIPQCVPDCLGRTCGDDGCGGQCGFCPDGQACDMASGQCYGSSDGCQPAPVPGCGGCQCEACVCAVDPFCCQGSWDEMCVQECQQCGSCGGCVPQCTTADGTWKQCGSDGCGGQCGSCPAGYACDEWSGSCIPGPQQTCQQGIDCVLSCPQALDSCLKTCSANMDPQNQGALFNLFGCVRGYCQTSSGLLPPDCFYQHAKIECESSYLSCLNGGTCIPSCNGRQCGDDGCGGQCGYCPAGSTCTNGTCVSQKNCSQILACAQACPNFNQTCVQQCTSGAGSGSQQIFLSLAQCVVQSCGYPPSAACVQKALYSSCMSQFQSCQYDGVIVPM